MWRTTVGSVAAIAFWAGAGWADEADARRILMAMSDYLAALQEFSFDYDSLHEIVSTEGEKIGLAHSGMVAVSRPDRIHATRVGGFTDLDMTYDGATFAVAERDAGLHAQLGLAADLDGLVDVLRDTHGRPLPSADLIVAEPFDILMDGVSEVKDLGSGVIGGVECDHLAFRNADVDWQIWIAQGDDPRPCLFVITSRDVDKAPQYSVTIRNWREDASRASFAISPSEGAREVDFVAFTEAVSGFPNHFILEDSK